MRNRLIVLALFAATAGMAQDANPLGEETDMSINVALHGPQTVQLAEIDPSGVAYDPARTGVTLVFTNSGDRDVTFPAQAILQKVVRRYHDLASRREQRFDISEPPSATAELTRLGPGESWSYGLGFEYPDRILVGDVPSWPLRVCAMWDPAALDAALYPAGSFDSVAAFETCFDVTVRR